MDEYIRLDTTIIGIDNLISKASTAEEANALFKAKDVIYSQQRCLTDVQPVKHGRWIRKHNSFPQRYFCTECGGGDVGRFAFCHHCGVEMDGDSE